MKQLGNLAVICAQRPELLMNFGAFSKERLV